MYPRVQPKGQEGVYFEVIINPRRACAARVTVHCKNNMVVLTHIRSTQFHGTTECTVKCISVRSLYSGKPSYIVFLWWG